MKSKYAVALLKTKKETIGTIVSETQSIELKVVEASSQEEALGIVVQETWKPGKHLSAYATHLIDEPTNLNTSEDDPTGN